MTENQVSHQQVEPAVPLMDVVGVVRAMVSGAEDRLKRLPRRAAAAGGASREKRHQTAITEAEERDFLYWKSIGRGL